MRLMSHIHTPYVYAQFERAAAMVDDKLKRNAVQMMEILNELEGAFSTALF